MACKSDVSRALSVDQKDVQEKNRHEEDRLDNR